MANETKYQVVVTNPSNNNSYTLNCDGIAWEYPQTDGEGSGATDGNRMIREVLPERDKITCKFQHGLTETELKNILKIRALKECSVNYYDLREGTRVRRTMYPVADAIEAEALIDGDFLVAPFELRFVMTVPITPPQL